MDCRKRETNSGARAGTQQGRDRYFLAKAWLMKSYLRPPSMHQEVSRKSARQEGTLL